RHDRSSPPPALACTAANAKPNPYHKTLQQQTNPNQITTPIEHRFSSDPTITILNPHHPLYDQTLPLVTITYHTQLDRCCVVWLRPHVERLVPVQATNLAFDP